MVFFVEAITILNTVTFCAFFLPLRPQRAQRKCLYLSVLSALRGSIFWSAKPQFV